MGREGAACCSPGVQFKIYLYMYKAIISTDALFVAYYRARRGNRDKRIQLKFELDLENQIFKLEQELKDEKYIPSPYTTFTIFEPKRREILAPNFRDRVVHQSLVSKIEPIFDKTFIADSYACRINKGTHYGVKRAKKFLQAARSIHNDKDLYVLQCDIKSYFASISWDVLFNLIEKEIDCPKTLLLVKKFISFQYVKDKYGNVHYPPRKVVSITERRGVPIGNLTSQLFANIYLNRLDHFVKETLKVHWYGRYMDDFYIIHPNRGKLKQLRNSIGDFLMDELKLTLHPRKNVIKNLKDGLPFVGYRIFHDHVLVRGNTVINMQRRLKSRKKQLKTGKISQEDFNSSISSYKGHLKHANAYGLSKRLFSDL